MRPGIELISAGEGLGPGAGGMIVYFQGLLAALCARDDVSGLVTFVRPRSEGLGIPTHAKITVIRCRALPRNRGGRVLYEQTALPALVARSNVDVLLSTHNTRPLLRRAPTVVVLQSLQYLFYPGAFGTLRRAYLRGVVPRSVRGADAVIAVSEWERRELIRLFDVDAAKIFTVYHGVSETVRRGPDSGSKVQRKRPYVVMVSSLYEFKNHDRLIRAFAQFVTSHGAPHELVLAGGDADVTAAALARVAAEEGIGDRVHFLGPVAHDAVPALLAGADAIAYPSLFETFGLPVLEALALGQPLVTSNVTAIPEVAGDAAVLVDPHDVDSIADGLAAALLDERLRARLREAGPRRVAEFTWARCAEGTMRALRHAIESRA